MDCSIVIRAYNEEQHIGRLLEGIVRQRLAGKNQAGLEDLAWARWAMDQGHAIAYVAEAEIVHIHNETPQGVYNRYRREAMAFKRIYPQERFSFLDMIHLASSNIASDLRQATRQRAFARNVASIFWFRWMQFWGTYQGYRHPGPITEHLRRTFYYPHQAEPGTPRPTRDVPPIQYPD